MNEDETIKYAVYFLHEANHSIENISSLLRITKKRIQNILKHKEEKKDKTPAKNSMMINETAGKKSKNVMIMTKDASMSHEQKTKQLTRETRQDTLSKNSIHKPLKDQ